MQADVAILSDEALEAALRRSLSCPPRLAGGDDAARFGAAHGYNNKFCADLQRYAVTLADLAAWNAERVKKVSLMMMNMVSHAMNW